MGNSCPTDQASTVVQSPTENSASEKPLDDQPFPFMSLPLELRTKIYEEHFMIPGPITPYFNSNEVRVRCDSHEPPHEQIMKLDGSIFRLLRTSKSIYAEAAPIFYSSNHFHLLHLDSIREVLNRLGPTSRRNITSISLVYEGLAPAKAARALRHCVDLRRLTIEISYFSIDLVPSDDGDLYRDLMRLQGLMDLLKIRGIQELEVTCSMRPDTAQFVHNYSKLQKALQVLRQPYKPAQLTRQERKDYPTSTSSQRTVYGKANVMTRSERKLIARQPSAAD